MVISGTASLAFKREFFAIKNLITATRSLIQRQNRMYILDPKMISKQRMFTTPSSPTISTSRPRDSASVFSKKTKAFIPLPPDLSMETLDDILKPIYQEASLYADTFTNDDQSKKDLFKTNLEAIRSVGANVLVMWSKEEIGDTGWKTGKDIKINKSIG